jgi:hypothetical protein
MKSDSGDLVGEGPPQAEADDSLLDIGHLQLSPVVTNALLAAKLSTIADALIFATSPAFADYPFRSEIEAALERLGQCTTGNKVDWRKYWVCSGMRFHHLSASLPELQRLSVEAMNLPLSANSFGKAALPLSRVGIRTLGSLRDGLQSGIPHVPGLGPGRRSEFFERLISVVDAVDAGGDVRHPAWGICGAFSPSQGPDEPSPDFGVIDPLRDCGAAIRDLPVGILHIGNKAMWLQHAGMLTVGQISAACPMGVGQLQNIGSSTIELVCDRLVALARSLREDGEIDWAHYSGLIGAALLPEGLPVTSGEAFLASLPAVVEQIAAKLDDQLEAAILLRRIARAPGEQATLDDLARLQTPKVSRERVRQKERGLLKDLARGLLWEDYGALEIHFRPEFADWWKTAAARFRNTEEITFSGFIEGLSEVWNVTPAAVLQQAPVILAIVTGDAQMPASFRSGFRIDPRLYDSLPAPTNGLKLGSLRLGKYAAELKEFGLETVGDVVALCRSGRIADIESRASREALSQIAILAGSLDDSGAVDWASYREKLGLGVLPPESPASPAEFVTGVAAVLEQLLERSGVTGRAVEIFRLRTCRKLNERLTLHQVAEKLETYPTGIKREETVFLEFLNDLVVERDFALAPAWLEEVWLAYWRDADEVYRVVSDDFDRFVRKLGDQWGLPQAERNSYLPVVWAVLSGYPNGRPASGKRTRALPIATVEGESAGTGVIRLVGFSRVY